jgi:hypothetical protein
MKELNNFSTRYPGQKVTFICDICGKRTRNTGDNGGVELCPECYDNELIENIRSDYGDEAAEEYISKNKKHKVNE